MAKKAAEAEKATVGAKEKTEEEKAAEAATANPGSASSDPSPPPTATSVSPTAPGVGEPAEFQIGRRYWVPQKNLPNAIAELKEKPLSKACWLILEDGVNKSKRMRFLETKMSVIAKTIQVSADNVASEVATEVLAADVAEQQQVVDAQVAANNWAKAANVCDEDE